MTEPSAGFEIDVVFGQGQEGAVESAAIDEAARNTLSRFELPPGHLAIEFVGGDRIAELNREFRNKPEPTDVLSFPSDAEAVAKVGALQATGGVPVEFGDVVICPAHTENVVEAVVHGVLHLLGFDHEVDDGEMLALQDEILAALR